MFLSTLPVLSSVLGFGTAAPINYQSSFDSSSFQISTPVSLNPSVPLISYTIVTMNEKNRRIKKEKKEEEQEEEGKED